MIAPSTTGWLLLVTSWGGKLLLVTFRERSYFWSLFGREVTAVRRYFFEDRTKSRVSCPWLPAPWSEHGRGRSVAPALASRHRRVLVPRSVYEARCQTLAVRSGRRRQRAGGLLCKCSARALHLLGEPDGCFRRRGRPWNSEGRWKAPIDGAFPPGPDLVGRTHDQQHPSRRRWTHTVEQCVCLGFAQIHAF